MHREVKRKFTDSEFKLVYYPGQNFPKSFKNCVEKNGVKSIDLGSKYKEIYRDYSRPERQEGEQMTKYTTSHPNPVENQLLADYLLKILDLH